MKEFYINKNDAGQRLDKYITKSVPLLPQSLMYKYIRSKRIKVNNKRSEISYRLKENDLVSMYINDEFFEVTKPKYDFLNAGKNLNIVYEDENILLCLRRNLNKIRQFNIIIDRTWHLILDDNFKNICCKDFVAVKHQGHQQ